MRSFYRARGSSVGEDDGVGDSAGASSNERRKGKVVVPGHGGYCPAICADRATGGYGGVAGRADADIEIVVALPAPAVVGAVAVLVGAVVTAVAVAAVVGPAVSVHVANQLHLYCEHCVHLRL